MKTEMGHEDAKARRKTGNFMGFDPQSIAFRHAEGSPLDDATEQLVTRIIGAAIEVHRVLGPGYLEKVYEEALCIELEHRSLSYQRQKPFEVRYCDRVVGAGRLDILVEDRVVVELKAVETMTPLFKAQTISYLRATDVKIALLINFNVPVLRQGVKRILL